MNLAVRRAVAGVVFGVALFFGAGGAGAQAETPSPTPASTATGSATPTTSTASATASATPSAIDASEAGINDTPDVVPDNSRSVLAIVAAGVLALAAALVVFLKRR